MSFSSAIETMWNKKAVRGHPAVRWKEVAKEGYGGDLDLLQMKLVGEAAINCTGFSILAISFDSTKSNTVFGDISDLGKGLGSMGLPDERMSRGYSKLRVTPVSSIRMYLELSCSPVLLCLNVDGDEPHLKAVAQENDADVAEDGDAQPAEALETAELAKRVEAVEPAKPVEAAKAAGPVKIPVPEFTATKALSSS
ncbi:hypothetical protein FVEG_14080 [Fusarium verticillioides 7600]|uniref:Uncharacterized protein n=1 Tax=Gibberella moniliformis (strain M3125 / FGSC 7600) TaxID=334819 RepID=W7N8A1_GIBM7|nr:hypothetical protein FVEG_14080 [Fusarium verticillioides 7600]EWG55979.1 hypothetical protein FVEG_14080 [Fusarium verticillioides 7600]